MTAVCIVGIVFTVVFSAACSWQDIKTNSVPNWLLASGIILSILYRFIFERPELYYSFQIGLITGFAAGLFYFIIRSITKQKLGMADVWFGIVQGLLLTPEHLFLCVMIECVSAGFVFLILINRKIQKLPFIPFMSLGLITSFLILNLT